MCAFVNFITLQSSKDSQSVGLTKGSADSVKNKNRFIFSCCRFETEYCFTVTVILNVGCCVVTVAVVVAFFICWAPFHAQRLMTIYIREDQWTPLWLELQSHLFYISGSLQFQQSVPITNLSTISLVKGKGKGRVLAIALLTRELVTRSALQSRKWQLVAMS